MSDLLPPNATALERAISESIDRPFPVVISELWSPELCPASLLPWLAWALSVDEWDSDWTESQKRGAVKASLAVHQKKGTIGALRSALGGLGYEISVQEWFQQVPPSAPYTFGLTVTVEQEGIPTATAYDKIMAVTDSAKNARSWATGLDVDAKSAGELFFGATFSMGETVTIQAEPAA